MNYYASYDAARSRHPQSSLQWGVVIVIIGFIVEAIVDMFGSYAALLMESMFTTMLTQFVALAFNLLWGASVVLGATLLLKLYEIPFLTQFI